MLHTDLNQGKSQVKVSIGVVRTCSNCLTVQAYRPFRIPRSRPDNCQVEERVDEVWIYGKLVYAQLLERRWRRRTGAAWGRLDGERTASGWRLWKLMRHEIAPLITGVQHWTRSQWPAAVHALTERRRQRPLQRLPAAVVAWLHQAKEESLTYAI